MTLPWRGLRTAASDDAVLTRLDAASSLTRIVVEIGGGPGSTPPRTRRQRAAYCSYGGSFLRSHRNIRDGVMWLEPNEPDGRGLGAHQVYRLPRNEHSRAEATKR